MHKSVGNNLSQKCHPERSEGSLVGKVLDSSVATNALSE